MEKDKQCQLIFRDTYSNMFKSYIALYLFLYNLLMHFTMLCQVLLQSKGLVTNFTFERFLLLVNCHNVATQAGTCFEVIITIFTFERFLILMNSIFMAFQFCFCLKKSITIIGFFPT